MLRTKRRASLRFSAGGLTLRQNRVRHSRVVKTMDAHLIGIELTQFVLKVKGTTEQQQPGKAGKAAGNRAVSASQSCISRER